MVVIKKNNDRDVSIYFAQCKKTVFTFALYLLFVQGCAVDKRTEDYKPIVNVTAMLPSHASELPDKQPLQNQLLKRNLVVDDSGEVLPINGRACDTDLYYRISQLPLATAIGRHRDLYTGFYLELAPVTDTWQVVLTDNQFAEYQTTGISLSTLTVTLGSQLSSADKFIIRPQPDLPLARYQALKASLERSFPEYRKQWILTHSQARKLGLNPGDYYATVRGAASPYLAETLMTTKARHRLVVKSSPSGTPATVATVVDSQTLAACQEASSVVKKVDKQPLKAQYSPLSVVAVLPANADFNQLERQATLLPKNQYLTFDGDIMAYDEYFAEPQQQGCAKQNLTIKEQQLCKQRIQDGNKKHLRRKVIMSIPTTNKDSK